MPFWDNIFQSLNFSFQDKVMVLFNIPIYAFFIPAEILVSNFQSLKLYSVKETVVNIYLNLLNAGIDFLLRVLISLNVLLFFYRYGLNIHLHPAVYWVLLVLLQDLLFYIEHFVDHHCRLFWAVHVTHHSSPEYNLSTGFRSSVLMPMYRFFYFIPLVLLNFSPTDIFFVYAITQSYGILVHTRSIKKLPRWIEYIFVTPSHHRVHHASNIPYLDKNMGMLLIVWDRMFGTFTPEDTDKETTVYGLTKPIDNPFHPVHIVVHEWTAIKKDLSRKTSLRNRLGYLFRPPGWSHDNSTKTSKQLQDNYR